MNNGKKKTDLTTKIDTIIMYSFENHVVDQYLSKIFEQFNLPLDIHWKKEENEWTGIFNIEDTIYEIFAKNYSKKQHWLYKFKGNDSFDLVGDYKKAFTVLPTIEKSINELFDEKKPEVFLFIAVDQSRGRKNIYDRFCKKIQNERFLNYYTEDHGKTKFFILTSHDYDGEELLQTILKIKKDYGIF